VVTVDLAVSPYFPQSKASLPKCIAASPCAFLAQLSRQPCCLLVSLRLFERLVERAHG
jgi:hypothetical protein